MKKTQLSWSLLAFLLSVMLSVGLSSCRDDDEIYATVNGSTTFDIHGGSRSIDVTSNARWNVTISFPDGSEKGWLTANCSSGDGGKTITITASENKTVEARRATVVFTCTSDVAVSDEISFTQEGLVPSLKVSSTNIQIPAVGSEKFPASFEIECNTGWNIDVDEDWVKIDKTSGYGDEYIEVFADDNKDSNQRSAKISISVPNTNLTKTVRVTQAEGDNLVVTPLDPKLEAEAGSTITISITANANWSLSGAPSWASFSSSQGGSGTTIVTIKAKEKNFSEKERSVNLTVVSGTKTETVKLSQEPFFDASVSVNVINELILSDGFYADLSFSNTLGYHEAYYYKYAFDVKTEEDIYNEVIENEIYGSVEYNYTWLSGLSPSEDYVYCCIPYSGDGKSRKYGKMETYAFKTKSSSIYCDAIISGSYNSTYWTYTISKQQRCDHYYKMFATNASAEYWYSEPSVLLALAIRERINDKVNYPNYDYYLNDGTSREPRETDDYAFFIWTWGVDDLNEFSGNISGCYANLSASVCNQTMLHSDVNKSLKPMKKTTRATLESMMKSLRIERENY